MFNKNIELTIKINEDAKKTIDCKQNFSLSKSVTIGDIIVDIDIDSEELSEMKKVIYKLSVVIINRVNNEEIVENFSLNFQSFDEICKSFMINCLSLNLCYNLVIEVDYDNRKYLNYFQNLRLGYINGSDLMEYVIHTDFKKNKNLLKLCDLSITNDYCFLSNKDKQFILDKLYYYGFYEIENSYYTNRQVKFKTHKELLEFIVGTTMDILRNVKLRDNISNRIDWIDTIYLQESNQLLLKKIIDN